MMLSLAFRVVLISSFLQAGPATEPAGVTTMPLPTMQDLRDMYAQGDYRTCLQQIGRVSRLTLGKEQFDKHEVALLRGECLIALGDARSASRALEGADDSPDPDVVRHARALEALIRNSPGLKYTPRDGADAAAAAIDLTDPAKLNAGMLALLNDQLAAIEPDVRGAMDAKDLTPIMPLVPRLLDLYALEQTATGSTDRATALGKPLGQHARDLITKELTDRDHQITHVQDLANELVQIPVQHHSGRHGWWWDYNVSRRGLVSDERDQLYDLIDYLKRIEQTCEKGRDVSRTVNGDVSAWEKLIEQAKGVAEHAQNVIDAEGIRTSADGQ